MLKEKYEDKVKTIKLISGEELISYTTLDEDGIYTLTKPLMAVLGVAPENPMQGQVSFCPWLICGNAHSKITLTSDKILAISNSDANAENQYIISVGDIRNDS